MKIFIGSDHGGFEMKGYIVKWLKEEGYEIEDVGAENLDLEDDFVDYSLDVVDGVLEDLDTRGILLCRNGVGVSITANRFAGVRCALGFDVKQVEMARADDNVNCLALPANYADLEKAKEMIKVFLNTEFKNEAKYQRRVAKLEMVGSMGGGCCGGGCCGDSCEDGSC
jgi:ribose 5-phosphate isomerase B